MLLPPVALAPIRTRRRVGVGVFRLKALIDLTVVSLLEIERDANLLADTEDAMEQVDLLLGLMPKIFYEEPPEDIGLQDAVDALRAFFEALPDPDQPERPEDAPDPDYGLLAARLAREYGGGAWHWLNECPVPVFNSSMAALASLSAEDKLGQMTVIALGNGRLPDSGPRIVRQWERAIDAVHPRETYTPQTMGEFVTYMEAQGIPVEVV